MMTYQSYLRRGDAATKRSAPPVPARPKQTLRLRAPTFPELLQLVLRLLLADCSPTLGVLWRIGIVHRGWRRVRVPVEAAIVPNMRAAAFRPVIPRLCISLIAVVALLAERCGRCRTLFEVGEVGRQGVAEVDVPGAPNSSAAEMVLRMFLVSLLQEDHWGLFLVQKYRNSLLQHSMNQASFFLH